MKQRAAELLERELGRFAAEHPRSHALATRAHTSLLSGVPMHWMMRWAGGFPVFAVEASGARFRDVDGLEYVDFCLGDTGAMTGHSPAPVAAAIAEQAARGITLMLPSEDALRVGEELTQRFGPSQWQFALTATDANRFAIRLARLVTGRPKVLVFNWCYHGTVDETFARCATARSSSATATSARRSRSTRRPGSSNGTTSRRSSGHSPTETSRACSPSRR
jgi:glutamate-1-semialdehyde 2,1-aminomutase